MVVIQVVRLALILVLVLALVQAGVLSHTMLDMNSHIVNVPTVEM